MAPDEPTSQDLELLEDVRLFENQVGECFLVEHARLRQIQLVVIGTEPRFQLLASPVVLCTLQKADCFIGLRDFHDLHHVVFLPNQNPHEILI